MITVTAIGWVARQPELKVLSPTAKKCEFDVLSKRSTKEGGQWVEVVESVTCVAWNDDAEYLAERLVPGKEVWVTGRQETSRWMTGEEKKKRSVVRVVDYELVRRSSGDGRQGRQGEQQKDSALQSPQATTPSQQAPRPVAQRQVTSASPRAAHSVTPVPSPSKVGDDPGPSEEWFNY